MNLIYDLAGIYLLSIIPAACNFFLDYALGHPMSDHVSAKAILFKYPLMLAKRKLSAAQLARLEDYYKPMIEGSDPTAAQEARDQLNVAIVTEGRKGFYWEQAFGMCPFCTNFWVAMLAALIVFFTIPFFVINPIFALIIIPTVSHTILRKL